MKRFDVKTEIKLLKAIDKLFQISDDTIDLTKEENKDKWIKSVSETYAIKGKTEQARRFLTKFADTYRIDENINKFDYDDLKMGTNVKISCSILEPVVKFMSIFDWVNIKTKHDYPMWIENEHFIVVIAPRIEEE